MKKGLLIWLLIILGLTSQAQDPYFTQNFYHKLYLNPSYTGLSYNLQSSLSYRNQWRPDGLPAYRSAFGSIDLRYLCFNGNRMYLAAGGYILADQEYRGAVRNLQSSISMSIGMSLSRDPRLKMVLMLGLSSGIIHRNLNLAEDGYFESYVLSGANFDPLQSTDAFIGKSTVEDIGVGTGLFFTFKKKYSPKRHSLLIGAAGQHLTSPELFHGDRVYRKFTANIASGIDLRNNYPWGITAYSDFTYQQKFYRSHFGINTGLFPDQQSGKPLKDLGLQAGLVVSVVGDETAPFIVEFVSPVLIISYQNFEFVVVKDVNVTTNRISHQKGGLEITIRYRTNNLMKKGCGDTSQDCYDFF